MQNSAETQRSSFTTVLAAAIVMALTVTVLCSCSAQSEPGSESSMASEAPEQDQSQSQEQHQDPAQDSTQTQEATTNEASEDANNDASSTSDDPTEPIVITADDISAITAHRDNTIAITGEAIYITPENSKNGGTTNSEIVLQVTASDGTKYKITASYAAASMKELNERFPDLFTGTYVNSGSTHYQMTITGKLDRYDIGDESGNLLGIRMQDGATVVDATPMESPATTKRPMPAP